MAEADPGLEGLLQYLHQSRGFDFTGYKRPTLARRIAHRMSKADVESFADYVDYLEVHPEEFAALFDTILINVTEFFRDPPAWDYLSRVALPPLISSRQKGESIRVWSAGCASGEEAYTIAMVLAELLGHDEFLRRVKIYATDIDEEALAKARQGYTADDVASVPVALREKYLDNHGSRYLFATDLRRCLIFGRHDLVQDAPISRLDLLVCRNTIMYLTGETQSRVLTRLHYALNDDGILFLGKAEMLLTHGDLFVPAELKHRVFAKALKPEVLARLLPAQAGHADQARDLRQTARLQELAGDLSPVSQIAIDLGGNLALANDAARRMFGLHAEDVGRPFRDLEISYRPAELRSAVERVSATRERVEIPTIERSLPGGKSQLLDIAVAPLVDGDGELQGTNVTFLDATGRIALQRDVEASHKKLETAYEELQSANEELQTTNEELQSTVEELETTNEELQSSNEELETMNEELESTNQELGTTNADLEKHSRQLDAVRTFNESLLASIPLGVVALNRSLEVDAWNARAEDLWGIARAETVGLHFFNLDIGLPVAELHEVIRDCLDGGAGGQEVTLAATNRRGKEITCRVTCAPLGADKARSGGVVLLMEEVKAGS